MSETGRHKRKGNTNRGESFNKLQEVSKVSKIKTWTVLIGTIDFLEYNVNISKIGKIEYL